MNIKKVSLIVTLATILFACSTNILSMEQKEQVKSEEELYIYPLEIEPKKELPTKILIERLQKIISEEQDEEKKELYKNIIGILKEKEEKEKEEEKRD